MWACAAAGASSCRFCMVLRGECDCTPNAISLFSDISAMFELIALYIAGLGFFFTGMAGISENLRQITGQRFRALLSRATNHPVRAGMLGAAAGAVTQSTSAVAFILS